VEQEADWRRSSGAGGGFLLRLQGRISSLLVSVSTFTVALAGFPLYFGCDRVFRYCPRVHAEMRAWRMAVPESGARGLGHALGLYLVSRSLPLSLGHSLGLYLVSDARDLSKCLHDAGD